jgi:hypothetical protein
MPISFLEQEKKNRFLLPVLGGIVLITLIIIWVGFFKKPSALPLLPSGAITSPVQRINIDWETLKNPILGTLEPFWEILPLKSASGRKNPFLPY